MSAGGRVARGVFWASTWAVGAAIGVAAGGWLTVVGGAGTPGVESLDLTEDLLVLPVLAGLAVFAVHLLGQALLDLVRKIRSRSGDADGDDDQSEQEVREGV